MRRESETATVLADAALSLAIFGPLAGMVLGFGLDQGASRVVVSAMWVASVALIGAFGIRWGAAHSRPLAIAEGAALLLVVVAFGWLTVPNNYWWSSADLGGIGRPSRYAAELVFATPGIIAMFLAFLAIDGGHRESRTGVIAKGWCAAALAIVLSTALYLGLTSLARRF